MKDQKRVNRFLKEFSSKLAEEFGEELDFILLFGSVVRKEWKRGISDVDMMIQVKNQKSVAKVEKFTEALFWKLDRKHGTQFKKVCSTAKGKEPIEKLFSKAKLYVPFEVFGPEDIDWKEGRLKKKEMLVGAELSAPQSMLFTKMKREGKILYGRNIKKVIKPRDSLWEKVKALLVPFYLSLISVLLCIGFPKTALKIATKATLFSVESVFFFWDKPVAKGTEKNVKRLERRLKEKERYRLKFWEDVELDLVFNFDYIKFLDFDFIYKAINLKKKWEKESKKFDRRKIREFCLQSFAFVNKMNWYAILKADRKKIILTTLIIILILVIIFS